MTHRGVKRPNSSSSVKSFTNPTAKQLRVTTIGSSGESVRTLYKEDARPAPRDRKPTPGLPIVQGDDQVDPGSNDSSTQVIEFIFIFYLLSHLYGRLVK